MIQEDTNDNWVGRNWKLLSLVRWTVTLIIMVFLRTHYEIQLMILITISVIFQAILIMWKPLKIPVDHGMSIFNEIMTAGYLYILMILTDF